MWHANTNLRWVLHEDLWSGIAPSLSHPFRLSASRSVISLSCQTFNSLVHYLLCQRIRILTWTPWIRSLWIRTPEINFVRIIRLITALFYCGYPIAWIINEPHLPYKTGLDACIKRVRLITRFYGNYGIQLHALRTRMSPALNGSSAIWRFKYATE